MSAGLLLNPLRELTAFADLRLDLRDNAPEWKKKKRENTGHRGRR